MVVVDRSAAGWVRNLFRYKGTALRRIWKRLLFTVAVSAVITFIDLGPPVPIPGTDWVLHYQFHDDLTPLPFSLIGVALGIFLGFRNNTSYDRFWEGRKLWGRMVNTSRSLTRQILTLVGPMPGESVSDADGEALAAYHRENVRRVAAYVHCFRHHLRDEKDLSELERLIGADEVAALDAESNRPVALLQTLGDNFRAAWLRGWVHAQHLPALEGSLTEMTDIQGGCERIKSTPIPFSYTALIHRIVAIYCYALPFGILNATQEYTPIVVMLIAYAFFGLDAGGDESEDPLGTDANGRPLAAVGTVSEVNGRQRIGDEDLPKIPTPQNELLQ